MAEHPLIEALYSGYGREIAWELDRVPNSRDRQKILGRLSKEQAYTLLSERDHATAVALSEHPNGYVREDALRILEPERSASLVALVRRASDWVPTVAKLATERAERAILDASDEELASALVPVFALTRLRRTDRRDLVTTYRHQVSRRTGLAKQLRRANRNGPLGVWVFRNLIGEDESSEEVAHEGLRRGSVLAQIEAASHLVQEPQNCPLLMGSKNPSIRRMGLDIAPTLARTEALCDPHPGVRNDARHLVGPRDFAAYYRDRLPTPGAISGLGEVGKRDDAKLIEAFMGDSDAEVRWRAVQAYARLLESAAIPQIFNALHDRSRKVQKAAVDALSSLPVSIEAREVVTMDIGRRNAWLLLGKTPRWSALLAVLSHFSTFPKAEEWLGLWAVRQSNHPMPPKSDQINDARLLLAATSLRLSRETVNALQSATKPWLT